MISVTGEYLINIIERQVNQTICYRRTHSVKKTVPDGSHDATIEEIADFILSIPFFDERIKNFILGTSVEKTIIISQSWEIAFILRAKKWSESNDWLHGSFRLSMSSTAADSLKRNADFLTLPY
jgi:hypothetical protein